MSTTQAIIEWDDETGVLVSVDGRPWPAGVSPFTSITDVHDRPRAALMLTKFVTPGQRVLPERPEGVPENAVLGFVYVVPGTNSTVARVYNLEGEVFDWTSDEAAIERYGVTFPEPTPEPDTVKVEIELTAAEVELLQASRFMWWRSKFTDKLAAALKPAKVPCDECGRPLRLNDDGTVWRDGSGWPWHQEPLPNRNVADPELWTHIYCTTETFDLRSATAPEGM